MKKIILLSLFAIIALEFNAIAQIEKGSVLIGSEFTNFDVGLNSPNQLNINFSPTAAWFVKDNLALGGYVNFSLQKVDGLSTTTGYGVGAFGRYYTGADMAVLNHGRFFGEASVGYAGSNGDTNALALGIGPGFSYFITPNVGLETLLKYNGLTVLSTTQGKNLQNYIFLGFGLQIYLPGKSTIKKIKNDIR